MKNQAFIDNLNKITKDKYSGKKIKFAQDAGINYQTFSQYFKRGSKPRPDNLFKIATAAEMSVYELYPDEKSLKPMINQVFVNNLKELVSLYFSGNIAECARKAEIPRSTLQSWLEGVQPGIDNFVKLARAVNMPISELYYRLYLEKEIVGATEKELGLSIEQFIKERNTPEEQECIDRLLKILKNGTESDTNFIKSTIDYILKDLS